MLFRVASGEVEELPIGAGTQVLTVVGGIPAWQNAAGSNAFRVFTPNEALFAPINGQTGIARIGLRNNRPPLLFIDTAAAAADNENAVFMDVLPASYSAANSLEVRIDWAAPAAITGGDVKWNAAFERMAILSDDIDVDSFAAIQTTTTTTSGVTGQLSRTLITFTSAQADGLLAGEDYRLQIVRDSNAIADTLLGDASVLRVSIAEV